MELKRSEQRKIWKEYNKANPEFTMKFKDFEQAMALVRIQMQQEYLKQIIKKQEQDGKTKSK